MNNPSRSITHKPKSLNDINFPDFSDIHVQFFDEMVTIITDDLANLDPGSCDYETFRLQHVSLQAMRQQMRWLRDATYATREAKKISVTRDTVYDPQSALEESDPLEDMDIEEVVALM